MTDDVVKVTTPAGKETTVSRRAWQGVYQYRDGWEMVAEYPDLEHKTRAQLDQIATARGLNPDDYGRKAELIAALEGCDE